MNEIMSEEQKKQLEKNKRTEKFKSDLRKLIVGAIDNKDMDAESICAVLMVLGTELAAINAMAQVVKKHTENQEKKEGGWHAFSF